MVPVSSRRAPAAVLGWLVVLTGLGCHGSGTGELASSGLLAVRRHEPAPRTIDVRHQTLELELWPERRRIEGVCRIEWTALERVTTVRLDLDGLEVGAVEDGRGRRLEHRQRLGVLEIRLAHPVAAGEEAELRVQYSGSPRFGLWFSGFQGGRATQVFTQGQTEASRGWFPCVDDPSERLTSEIQATFPASWTSIAPGRRVASEVLGERRRETWRMAVEHPVYLTSLVAGELVVREGRHGSLPLLYACEARLAPALEETFAETPAILAFLEDLAGRDYPYSKYAQTAVDDFPWGGMENASATTLTPLLLSDALGRADQPPYLLIAHEAAHQWFGDLVTCVDWSEVWLNEGFATYLTLLYVEHTRGEDEFRARLRDLQEEYLARDVGSARRPTVWKRWREADDMLDSHAYQGAAARLHLLRFVLGDDDFRAGLRAYLAENAGKSVVTDDLRRALERTSGRDLGGFFRQWFHQAGFPELAVDWTWAAGQLELTVEQVQEPRAGTPLVFELPFEVAWQCGADESRARCTLDERRARFTLAVPERPEFVHFDPEGWIPKRLQQSRAPSEWLAIAARARNVNARREAAFALARAAGSGRRSALTTELRAALERLLTDDASAWVRADAAGALALAFGAEVRAVLVRAVLEDYEPRVRRAALAALAVVGPDPGLASLAEDVFSSGPSWQVRGAAAALLRAADPERAFEWLHERLLVPSPHDVLAAEVLRELAATRAEGVEEVLRAFADDETRAASSRATALELLGGTTRATAASVLFLRGFLERESLVLRRAALSALARFSDPTALRALGDYYPRSRTPQERRLIEAALERREP